MEKTKIRIILVLVAMLSFSFALFGVLYAEETKSLARRDAAMKEFMVQLRESDRSRKEYYDNVAKQKEILRQQMADAEASYTGLLKDQASIIEGKKEQVTKVVEQKVPVTVAQPVAKAKPKSTKKTKSS